MSKDIQELSTNPLNVVLTKPTKTFDVEIGNNKLAFPDKCQDSVRGSDEGPVVFL